VAVTSATIVIFGEAIWDPVVLIARIGSPLVIIVGALVVPAAQLTTKHGRQLRRGELSLRDLFEATYTYASFVTFVLSFVICLAVMPRRP
jgi:nucleobase:cation symporter-1, NCS1 family